jgi:hypothetical protein
MKLTGENGITRGKTCPSATLSTTNPTWTDPGTKPGLRGGRRAANRLSHGTAQVYHLLLFFHVQHAKISTIMTLACHKKIAQPSSVLILLNILHPHTFICTIQFNIIITTSKSIKWTLPLRLLDHNTSCISLFFRAFYMSCLLNLLDLFPVKMFTHYKATCVVFCIIFHYQRSNWT